MMAKEPNATWLHTLYEALSQVQALQHEIYRLSNAFKTTGNAKVAGELSDWGEVLSHIHELIGKGIDLNLGVSTQNAQNGLAMALTAAIAVVGKDLPEGDAGIAFLKETADILRGNTENDKQ